MRNSILSVAVLYFISSALAGNLALDQSGELMNKYIPTSPQDGFAQALNNFEQEAAEAFASNIVERIEFIDTSAMSAAAVSHDSRMGLERLALTDKATPPLENLTVKQVQDLTLVNAFKTFQDLIAKAKAKKVSAADLEKTYFAIITAFIQARSDATRAMDGYFVAIWNAYRQLPATLNSPVDKLILPKFKEKVKNDIPANLKPAERKQLEDAINKF